MRMFRGAATRGAHAAGAYANDFSPEDAAVADRFGRERYFKRVRMEMSREYALFGMVRWCPLPAVSRILRVVLKVSGLWDRGYREFLSPVVVRNEVFVRGLPDLFDGFTVLHFSDMHLDLDERLAGVIAGTVSGLKYDAVAITGDFNNMTIHPRGSVAQRLSRITGALHGPVFGVLGNHDSLHDVPFYESLGITMLLNESVPVERGGEKIYFVGIDDPNKFRTDDLDGACRGIPPGAVRLLLSHSPCIYARAAAAGIDFVMSGHLHGGQICLPSGRMIHVRNDSSPRRFWSGAWREGGTQGWTTRGLGGGGVPVRLNCSPEAVLHVLRRADAAPGSDGKCFS